MDARTIRWPIVLLVGVVLFGALWFGSDLVRTTMVVNPLKNSIAAADGVESVNMINGTDGLTVVLTVKSGADLQHAYDQAMQKAGLKSASAVTKVVVQNSDDPVLTDLYRQKLAFHLQEAIATGRYAGLPTAVEQAAAADGATATLTIDEEHLYLTIHKADKVHYEVVNRKAAPTTTGGATP